MDLQHHPAASSVSVPEKPALVHATGLPGNSGQAAGSRRFCAEDFQGRREFPLIPRRQNDRCSNRSGRPERL